MVHILEDIEEMALGHPLFEQGFNRVEGLGHWLREETFQMRRALSVESQGGVVGIRGIDTLRHLSQPVA
jgi:hypothetical protein